jgi:integrase
VPLLADVLRIAVGDRRTGPVFRQRRCAGGYAPALDTLTPSALERETERRLTREQRGMQEELERERHQAVARTVWRDMGALRTDWIRIEFMRLTKTIGQPEITAPKTFRHTFATLLQDANVDPLIRSELMGHSTTTSSNHSQRNLGTTAVYTHTRPETKRRQLEDALDNPTISNVVASWIQEAQMISPRPGATLP